MRPYSEARREIDLQRYYHPWLDAQNLINQADGSRLAKGLTYEGYQPRTSHDKALTAFAQLATLRLNVRRAMVSLIDSNKQYILAEATRTLSLYTQNAERKEDEVWLGHSVIARADAVCPHALNSTYTALEENGDEYSTNAMVVPDCRKDSRFCNRDYVVSEPGVRFYAGVPITTKNGHRIGVYAVSDDKPRDALSAADVRFLEDVAATVMEHLELAKDRDARNTGQRMVNGLTDFIQRSCLKDSQSPAGHRPSTLERQTENARLQAIGDEEPTSALPVAKQAQRKRESEPDTSRIFQRAARIIRQSTFAEGVVFFDISAAHLGQTYDSPNLSGSSDENSYSSATAGSATASQRKRSLRHNKSGNQGRTIAEVLEGGQDAIPVAESKPCPVAGLSCRSNLAPINDADFVFTESTVERYINRYPQGKFFNFDAEGMGINSSDERSERSDTDKSVPGTAPAATNRRPKKDRFIPTELIKILPNVRSLIFLPLFDPASEKWIAAGFVWTTTTGRILNPDNELPYLKAFGNSITSEIARWNALKADRAKTTFIASISHELRSPLHGILGSVEFLRDAVSSNYQQSLVHSIETCGKTLLDTIDHVLDYAKINKLRNANAHRKQNGKGRNRRVPADNSILGVTTVFDLAQLVEEVCDTVCAGHTFRKTHDVNNVAFHDQGSRSRTNSTISEELPNIAKTKKHVVVTLNITPFMKWTVRSQPGALRRVVMNLLGNALKYTESGFVKISLEQNQEKSDRQSMEFTIAVEDSGRGMSNEYQRTRLFAPFSQEDPFSNGTGLGLSIIKQIVESLKGEVDVQSTLGVGTKVGIALRLPTGASEQTRADSGPTETSLQLKDKVASIVIPSASLGGSGHTMRDSVTLGCHGCYMKTETEFEPDRTYPHYLITEPDSLMSILEQQHRDRSSFKPLTVVCICIDPTEKTATESKLLQFATLPWVIHVVAQPCGPRKLVQMLLDGEQQSRVIQLPTPPADVSPIPALVNSSTDPKLPILRSISELTLGSNAVPSSIQKAHSPLISAAMPNNVVSPSNFGEVVETPGSESAAEYFTPRVLLVDDNAINLKLLVVFAQRQNLRYVEATNGLEALNVYKKEATSTDPPSKPFDFILMDLSMPVMDGLESTRSIRQFESENHLKKSNIVALTGLASAQDQRDAYDAGVDEYLVKPVKFADIKRVFGMK